MQPIDFCSYAVESYLKKCLGLLRVHGLEGNAASAGAGKMRADTGKICGQIFTQLLDSFAMFSFEVSHSFSQI